eukprot:scaffold250579_cov31-Tisochrysis_lutea.AAC.1
MMREHFPKRRALALRSAGSSPLIFFVEGGRSHAHDRQILARPTERKRAWGSMRHEVMCDTRSGGE